MLLIKIRPGGVSLSYLKQASKPLRALSIPSDPPASARLHMPSLPPMMELSDINQQESSTWKERGRYQNDGITGLSLEKGKTFLFISCFRNLKRFVNKRLVTFAIMTLPNYTYSPKLYLSVEAHHQDGFGPLLVIYPYQSGQEAVKLASDTSVGLAGYIFTNSLPRAWRVEELLEVLNGMTSQVNSV
ncbi:hypothetical protein ASPNIDRAFT_45672 [Aspergillus niger ATCC 1015]|uniref:Aldehyde dehydrogenase domain-containing protein n=1 Tax=Aspergillus niger (strain ATCC 1015 / CBS 113.46 / FGSC A1144 / LSHB Ac4 / NCTC 3858a / NRRL 328 / USDA 3528.7) TaxID=380704 RepID=G3Y8H6_ASPNA|nr:hypothetical protein ASPNIDRAFT_45672 [Aspergillus niger ATCC 1015]